MRHIGTWRQRPGVVLLGALGAGTVAVLLSPRLAASEKTGAVTGQVTVQQKGLFSTSKKADPSGVVVYLEKVLGPLPVPPASHPTLRQRDKAFLPRLLVVTRGTTIDFPNEDKIFHNVFSLSQAIKFDLGLYKSGTSKSVVFDRAGVIDVYCNIHPEMVASILVLDSAYYAITDKSGRFRISHVPPGTYPIVAWQPRSEGSRGTVNVTAGGTAEVSLEVREGGSSQRHQRKDGTPYGRYQ